MVQARQRLRSGGGRSHEGVLNTAAAWGAWHIFCGAVIRADIAGTVQVSRARPEVARDLARGESDKGPSGDAAGTASGATLGAIAGGGIGAVPGALIGHVVGQWLTDVRAREYERDVADGGVLLVVQAPELEPAAHAEDMLRQASADHVESGETPRL